MTRTAGGIAMAVPVNSRFLLCEPCFPA